jgi:predicted transcriptional regulator
MANSGALLLSVRPRFAHAILDGTKTVELRRRRIAALPGTSVILYATCPTKAVVGTARIARTVVCRPETAWRDHAISLGLERHEFDGYLAGATSACLLFLEKAEWLESPLSLAELRLTPSFRPPQSYRYVSRGDPAAIRDLTGVGER